MIRPIATLVAFALAASTLVGAGSEAHAKAADSAELERTWRAAAVYVPQKTADDPVKRTTMADHRGGFAGHREAPLPVVIYAHGCSGLDEISYGTGRFLAREGYLFIAPDSFARLNKPKSCDVATRKGGLHRPVSRWRQAEMKYAILQIRSLPGIDTSRIYAFGFSEGGVTVATMLGEPVRARIIEGWTCHAGWPEYRGLNAPPDEPVLALVGENDPWFKLRILRGDCGAFMGGRENARSVVYRPPFFLHKRHHVSFHDEARAVIREFLEAHN